MTILSEQTQCQPYGPLSPWQEKIIKGNQAFQQGQLSAAKHYYQQALAITQWALDNSQAPSECMLSAFVISHHNLADCYCAEHNIEAARTHLCQPYQRLNQLAEQQIDVPNLYLHQQRARIELMQFCKHYGPDNQTQQLLKPSPNSQRYH